MLAFNMRCFGYETIESATGADAIKKAFRENPDLIVMDIGLPDMTGIEVEVTNGKIGRPISPAEVPLDDLERSK